MTPDESRADAQPELPGGAEQAIGGGTAPDGPLLRLIKDRRVAFLVVGGLNTGIGFVWFILFSTLFRALWHGAGWTIFLTITVAHVFSTISAFVLYRKLVFRVTGHLWLDFWRFQLVYLTSFLLNQLVVPPLTLLLGLHPVLAQLLFTFVIAVISWFGHSRFSFHRRKEER
ncbi:GtrA family protein [Microbacterium sp. JZ31]|uniref:GtrA family protein n=1 Tax=Microbacterium sp. JZ31 TaxID=1906274 RepID=UPI001931181E|nr:GtrA family protein [Microbacterium sp. JZ31]